MSSPAEKPVVAVIGAGPAGLMAAEVLSEAGVSVDIFEAKPSIARKFLQAGVGGMNITHSEPFDAFVARYGGAQPDLQACLGDFDNTALRAWVHDLGIETFVGSSGRVFPVQMKAAPLLRAWRHRLRARGVRIHTRHRWRGWLGEDWCFETPGGDQTIRPAAAVLALGGGSWSRLGSDAAWVPWLRERGIVITPLRAANCGFECRWTTHFRGRFAGEPVKPVGLAFSDSRGVRHARRGEFIATEHGVEGGLVYALSAALRDTLSADGRVSITLDLLPDREPRDLERALAAPRGSNSLANHLRKRAGIRGVKAGLLREAADPETLNDPVRLAGLLKALPLTLTATRPLDEAISTAGGVAFTDLNPQMMLQKLPGVFCAGEMLDWEAPTGGYLLTACFATGRAAGAGVLDWLGVRP